MDQKEYLPGVAAPVVRVDRSEKDLTIEGWNEPRIAVECDEDPRVEPLAQGISIRAEDDLLLRVPYAARVEVVQAEGDVVIRDLQAGIVLRECKGDLILRHCAGAELGTVRGSLTARDLSGDLQAQSVSGDAKLRQVSGAVELDAGGDVRIEHPIPRAQIRSGGDASVAVQPRAGTESRISAHGDLRCYLPPDASAAVEGKAGGDAYLRHPSLGKEPQTPLRNGTFAVTLGTGAARLSLEAEGDLWLGGWMDVDSWGEWRELGRDAGQLGMEFGMLASEFGRWAERNMHDRFEEYEKRLRRKMEDTKYGFNRRRSAWEAAPPRAQSSPGASESERLAILDMLQKGKITVEEAERLLAALEKTV